MACETPWCSPNQLSQPRVLCGSSNFSRKPRKRTVPTRSSPLSSVHTPVTFLQANGNPFSINLELKKSKCVFLFSVVSPLGRLYYFFLSFFDRLVCSDLISCGIDINHVSHVVSYDAPVDMRKYVHRVGRTARAGRTGDAWSLVEEQEVRRYTIYDTYHVAIS